MAMYFKSGRRFGKFKNEVRNFTDELKRDFNKRTRQAALSIINDLAKNGPVWTGKFQNSWIAKPLGAGGQSITNGTYPYKISDIPKLSIKKEQFQKANKFEISNTSKYALFALDIEKGVFKAIGNLPDKFDTKGTRQNPSLRGEIASGEGDSISTAPLFWYQNYIKGGGLQKSIGKGISFGDR